MILAGAYLLDHFHWLFYVFGTFLIVTGWRMFSTEEEFHPENQPLLRWIKAKLPISSDYDGSRLFTVKNGRRLATPFFLALIAIEFTDLIFAIDSIPAVFAVTSDPFVVYSSNAFAVLGLRSLYFLLSDAMDKFHYLKHGLGIILALVGTKMVVADWLHVSSLVALSIILLVLLGSSFFFTATSTSKTRAQGVRDLASRFEHLTTARRKHLVSARSELGIHRRYLANSIMDSWNSEGHSYLTTARD